MTERGSDAETRMIISAPGCEGLASNSRPKIISGHLTPVLGLRQRSVYVWKLIFICFSMAMLSCAIKNYMIFLWHDSHLCVLLCPSFFGNTHTVNVPAFVEIFYGLQQWIGNTLYSFILKFIDDPSQIILVIFVAPIVEEILYRGPLFYLKSYLDNYSWWSLAIVFAVLFTYSHSLYGISLFPIFILGLCCSWLIKVSNVFWPTVILHILFNFYSQSFLLYQSLYWVD